MKLKQLIYGIATFVPGVVQFWSPRTGGTSSARYCYSIWLRHLVLAKKSGLNHHPQVVAELGPGDSLGIGLAALLSGCEKYYALDVVEHANTADNLKILLELEQLFRARAPVPDESEFPNVSPKLDTYEFPSTLLDEERMKAALRPERIDLIKNAIAGNGPKNSPIQCKAPWNGDHVIENESVDMIYSQAVMEHVDDLEGSYSHMKKWLKPGGFLSHQIDFKCHGTTEEWNGHWACTEGYWKLMRGKRPYLLNRHPHSVHTKLLHGAGFQLVSNVATKSPSRLQISDLAPRFRMMSEEDLVTSGAFIQAVKTVDA